MSVLLSDFINNAARAGKSRKETMQALREAGWAEDQIKDVFSQYHDGDFPVPVPRPRAYVSPRYTAINLLMFLVLYLSIWAVVSLIFTFLDYYLPDGLGKMRGLYHSSRPIAESLRGYLATVIVCVPLVGITQRLITRMTESSGNKQTVPVIRLKLISLTLFFAALILLGNFVCFVYYFLSGELGMRFIIKVLVLSAVIAGIYYYYRPEVSSNEKKA